MSRLYSRSVGVMVMVAAAVAVASLASAQDRKEPPKKSDRHSDHSNHQGRKGGTEGSLAAQLAELRAKVAKLEAALAAGHPKPGATSTAGRGMKGMPVIEDGAWSLTPWPGKGNQDWGASGFP